MLPRVAVILTDNTKKIIWVNEDFTHITGYALSEVLGKKPGTLLQGSGTEREAVQRIRKALRAQVPIKDEITNYRKSGESYLCKLVIYPVFDDNRQLTNFIAFEIDADKVDSEENIPLLQLHNKYSSSSLKGSEEIRLFYRLKRLIEDENLYLDPDLTLKNVADRLATNTKYLSQVVNHHANTNFQQFLNTYRIEEVKQKITDQDYQNLTLYGIAMQCGFKNKSTFYKVFKEMTGHTPRSFLKASRRGRSVLNEN